MFETEARTSEAAPAKAGESFFEAMPAAWADETDPFDGVVQMASMPAVDPAIYGLESDVHAAAAEGIATPAARIPHFDHIQHAFGAHDISGIQAHVGGTSAAAMGAKAFAAGDHVVFDREPDLHTAAHEAAHVIQQARGVNLYGGVGEAGDGYERAADAVADRVVAGESAADLLGEPGVGLPSSTAAVQRKEDLTRDQYTARADGNRGSALGAHLRLAAMTINTACSEIEAAIAQDGPNAQAVIDKTIKPACDRANETQRTLHPLWEDMQRMGFRDRNIRDGLGIFNSARRRFSLLQGQIQQWAARNGNPTMTGVNAKAVEITADRFAKTMGVDVNGSGALWGTEDKKTTERDLIQESVAQSLSAVEASTTALAMAMRENVYQEERKEDREKKATTLGDRALMDLHLLDASIPPNAKTSDGTWKRMLQIEHLMEQAWRDADLKEHGTLRMARGAMQMVKAKLAKARDAK